jgi:hypothetical protein
MRRTRLAGYRISPRSEITGLDVVAERVNESRTVSCHVTQVISGLADEAAPDSQGEPDRERQDTHQPKQRPRTGGLRQRPGRGRR